MERSPQSPLEVSELYASGSSLSRISAPPEAMVRNNQSARGYNVGLKAGKERGI
jgi:hypothetical protein